MAKKIRETDHYIANSAPFAQPILRQLREIVHRACPETTEVIKWGFPNFEYKGTNLCSMASFKAHCTFGFWKGHEIDDPYGVIERIGKTAMGSLGKLSHMDDLPSEKILTDLIKRAMKLNENPVKPSPKTTPQKAKPKSEEIYVPTELDKVLSLKKNAKARAVFDAFSASHKREYCEWISEAKKEETKSKRVERTIEMLLEGKSRNWKYETKKK
jgi:uncharacterized protein YdeI (YjbR/CyaY-like superfamily)